MKILGREIKPHKRAPNEIIEDGAVSYIILYDRKGFPKGFSLVDTSDVPLIKDYKWSFYGGGYVRGSYLESGTNKYPILHVLLLGNKKGFVIDHINRDRADNRRCNLRYLTQKENCYNSARSENAKGYYLFKPTGKWAAYIQIDGKTRFLGFHETPELAREARLQAQKSIPSMMNVL